MSNSRSTSSLVAALVVLAAGIVGVLDRRGDAPPGREATAAVGEPAADLPDRHPTTTAAPTTGATASVAPPSTAPPTTAAPQPPAVLVPILAGGPAEPSGEPGYLIEQLVAAERVIRDPASPPDWVVAAGRLQQVAYRKLAHHPDWEAQVYAGLPVEWVDAATRQVAARREFMSMHTRLSSTLPAWRIVDPLPADQLLALYQEAEAAYGVPWNVLAAVNLVETGMGRIVGLSSAGAQGPMQFMPGTWERYGLGGDVWNTRDAILGAANYLAANGANNGTEDGLNNGLFRYNNDNRYVRAVRHYAAIMAADPSTFRGFHAWQIVFVTDHGDIVLPTGYETAERIPVVDYLAANPR